MAKISAFLAFMVIIGVPYANGALPAKDLEEVLKLLEDIPPPHVIHTAINAIRQPEIVGAKGVEEARNQIARAKTAIPKLRKLIKVSTSIFDYPGLLCRGFLSSSGEIHTNYDLHVSATYVGAEAAVSSYEFEIFFDDRGMITSVDDVRWK